MKLLVLCEFLFVFLLFLSAFTAEGRKVKEVSRSKLLKLNKKVHKGTNFKIIPVEMRKYCKACPQKALKDAPGPLPQLKWAGWEQDEKHLPADTSHSALLRGGPCFHRQDMSVYYLYFFIWERLQYYLFIRLGSVILITLAWQLKSQAKLSGCHWNSCHLHIPLQTGI